MKYYKIITNKNNKVIYKNNSEYWMMYIIAPNMVHNSLNKWIEADTPWNYHNYKVAVELTEKEAFLEIL